MYPPSPQIKAPKKFSNLTDHY
uniref:Uncharacterized protein n=1 Tax=Rhizophora mucronata TaxID=61149 RepID=A0A2P2QWV2_RHIMU